MLGSSRHVLQHNFDFLFIEINAPLSYWNTHVDMFHDFVDYIECWEIMWALVDDKLEILLDTLHATNRDLYPAIYSIISFLLTLPVSSQQASARRRLKSYYG